MNRTSVITGVITILFYLLFLLLYLQDVINESVFVCILFLSLIILLIILIVLRKNRGTRSKIAIATFIIFLLFFYEFPLALVNDPPSLLAYAYKQPTEVLNGSGIFLVGVNQLTIKNQNSKQDIIERLTRQQVDVLSVVEVNNKIIYINKNQQILRSLIFNKKS